MLVAITFNRSRRLSSTAARSAQMAFAAAESLHECFWIRRVDRAVDVNLATHRQQRGRRPTYREHSIDRPCCQCCDVVLTSCMSAERGAQNFAIWLPLWKPVTSMSSSRR